MSIDVHVEYVGVTIDHVVNILRNAEGDMSVSSYSFSESAKGFSRSANWERLDASKHAGLFLYSETCQFSLSATQGGAKLDCMVDSQSDAEVVLSALDSEDLAYGFAADPEEWKHRNRLSKNAAYGLHEGWVGMKGGLLPGLYWRMILSRKELANLGDWAGLILAEACEVVRLESEGTLIKFYSEARDWRRNTSRLDMLCQSVPTVFSISKARNEFEDAHSFLEAAAVLKKWQ